MAELVNLRTARKRMKRRQADARAAANRLAHGTARSAHALAKARDRKASRDLAAHRVEREEGP